MPERVQNGTTSIAFRYELIMNYITTISVSGPLKLGNQYNIILVPRLNPRILNKSLRALAALYTIATPHQENTNIGVLPA